MLIAASLAVGAPDTSDLKMRLANEQLVGGAAVVAVMVAVLAALWLGGSL